MKCPANARSPDAPGDYPGPGAEEVPKSAAHFGTPLRHLGRSPVDRNFPGNRPFRSVVFVMVTSSGGMTSLALLPRGRQELPLGLVADRLRQVHPYRRL